MPSDINELSIVGVEKDKIEKDDSFPAAYRYPFKLSDHPDPLWCRCFEHTYGGRLYSSMKREAYIEGDCIVVITADSDDKQHQADIIKRAVADTNETYRRIKGEMEAEEQRQNELQHAEREKLDSLKGEADDIQI